MSDPHDTHDFQKSVKRYLFVFYALIVGTVVTVMASRLHINSVALTVAVALFIACVKGFGGRLFHAPDFGKENDLRYTFGSRFLFCRPDVSYGLVNEPAKPGSHPRKRAY